MIAAIITTPTKTKGIIRLCANIPSSLYLPNSPNPFTLIVSLPNIGSFSLKSALWRKKGFSYPRASGIVLLTSTTWTTVHTCAESTRGCGTSSAARTTFTRNAARCRVDALAYRNACSHPKENGYQPRKHPPQHPHFPPFCCKISPIYTHLPPKTSPIFETFFGSEVQINVIRPHPTIECHSAFHNPVLHTR